MTRGGNIISYVKIAQDEPVSALLEHEANMLSWLHSEGFPVKDSRRFWRLEHEGQFTLLFLSPPANPRDNARINQMRRTPDFLSGLASLNVSKPPIAEVFDDMGFDAYLEQVLAQNREAAAILRLATERLKIISRRMV